MMRNWAIAFGCVASIAAGGAATSQQPANPAGDALPKGQTPILGRPTVETDPVPIFDFDHYFLGKWSFELDVPDTDLGPGGTIAGTTEYRAVKGGAFEDGGFYEADTDAKGPSGPFKIKELFAYQRVHKTISRQVTDSRGFSYLQIGPVGADLGGYFNLHLDGSPFTYKGKTFRIGNNVRMLSPVQYKTTFTLSVNGGPPQPYGNAWWKKQLAPTSGTAR